MCRETEKSKNRSIDRFFVLSGKSGFFFTYEVALRDIADGTVNRRLAADVDMAAVEAYPDFLGRIGAEEHTGAHELSVVAEPFAVAVFDISDSAELTGSIGEPLIVSYAGEVGVDDGMLLILVLDSSIEELLQVGEDISGVAGSDLDFLTCGIFQQVIEHHSVAFLLFGGEAEKAFDADEILFLSDESGLVISLARLAFAGESAHEVRACFTLREIDHKENLLLEVLCAGEGRNIQKKRDGPKSAPDL